MNSQSESNAMYFHGTCVLPDNIDELYQLITNCDSKIAALEEDFFAGEHYDDSSIALEEESECPVDCVPVSADVTTFDFPKFASIYKNRTGSLFDVIMMDPPWRIASSNPTRGVTIAYDTLRDRQIKALDIPCLQSEGFLFVWTVNSKLEFSLSLLAEWGYKFQDLVSWVKQSKRKKILKGNGYYLQHAKETCLIGVKGDPWKKARKNIMSDCMFSKRRGQSQKPNDIYHLIETLVPNGNYLEIFGRRNNLRSGWVTIGNEL